MQGCAGVEASGVKVKPSDEEAPEMEPRLATLYRRGAAKANDISQERPDIAYASKERSRSMAKPRAGDEVKLEWFARYLQKVSALHFAAPVAGADHAAVQLH